MLKNNKLIDALSELSINSGRYYNLRFVEYFPLITSNNPMPSSYLLKSSLNLIPFPEEIIDDVVKIIEQRNSIPTCFTINKIENQVESKYEIEYYFFQTKRHNSNDTTNNIYNLIRMFSDNKVFNKKLINEDFYLLSITPQKSQIKDFTYFTLNNLESSSNFIEILGFKVNVDFFKENGYTVNLINNTVSKANEYFVFIDQKTIWQLLTKLLKLAKELFPIEDPKIIFDFFDFPYLANPTMKLIGSSLPTGIAKKKNSIGLYFNGISFNRFILFLEYHRYPNKYIYDLKINKDNLKHLLFDIKIDLYIEHQTLKIKKTAFFGNL